MNIQVCRDTSDAVALYLPQRLYLKSFAKLNISVQLPSLKVNGKAISNWELMEKLRKMILPESFSVLKVSKNSTEVIRFDAELESRDKLDRVLCRLDDRMVQLTDYPEALRVRVSEAKSDFPSRHSWDSFFRDATDMDEMKPGERPDTVHISNLPIRWFVSIRDRDEDAPPSEGLFKKVFEKFGSIRQVDVPAADPFRMQMKAAMRGITVQPQDAALYFEGYIQFSEYVGFVRCMDALRGRKLLRKKDDIAEWCGICVDFDKTKHMTDAAVKRRSIVRERLTARQRAKDQEEQTEKEKIAKREAKEKQKQERAEREKLERMREREEKRKKKQLAKLMAKDGVDVNGQVVEEEKKLLKAQRRLQALRLVEELFKRIELRRETERGPADRRRAADAAARERVVAAYKREQQGRVDRQRDRVRRATDGRIVIRTALDTKKHKSRASSISSFSSDEEARSKTKTIKTENAAPDGEADYKAAGVFGLPPPYGYGYPFPAPPPAYPYHHQNMYYPMRGAYYPPPPDGGYAPRRPYTRRPRARPPHRGHGNVRMPNLDDYYRFVKKFESEGRNEHDDRDRIRSRSRSRRRSYTRSRSRSRRRSRSRSRSRRRSYSRSRSRSRRSRSRSRRSRSRRSRSHKSRSRSKSKSRSRRTRSKSRSKSRKRDDARSKANEKERDEASVDSSKFVSPATMRKERSKSWSLPKEGERKSWSKSPKNAV